MLKTEISSIICFSPEEEPQPAIKKFDAYEGWKTELYKPFMESREFEIERRKPDNSNTQYEKRKNDQSSTKQVELGYLKEEIKYIKRNIDIQLKRQ